MITHSTKVENNQFKVTFDFTPKDVRCSRGNYTATHKGGNGTSHRYGIWEGVRILDVQTKIGNNAWVKHGTSKAVTLTVNDNGIPIQAWCKYELKTMGYHFQCTNGSIPFFYYGNIDGDPYKYVSGKFTDSRPASPGSQSHDIHAIVPKDWRFMDIAWSNWAYEHAKATDNWQFDWGNFEQRNGNYEGANSSNGWISDSGWAQIYRKSCMFYFQKEYYSSVVNSSGIIKDAKTPEITVQQGKGSTGNVTLKYVDPYDKGHFWLRAYCADKQVEIEEYSTSALYSNGQSKTYNIDFYEVFGVEYEGNDVYYEAWAKNTHEKESAGTGRRGVRRFNAKPTKPTGLTVTGKNNIIYDNITFAWNPSTDKDGDALFYTVNLRSVDHINSVIRDRNIAVNINKTSFDYNVINDGDNTDYYLTVTANDGIISSDVSDELVFKKGSKPKNILSLIMPTVSGEVLYSDNTRFIFSNYDKESTVVINHNGTEFNSIDNPDLFTIKDDKVLYLGDTSENKNITLVAYLRNSYGESEKSNHKFVKKQAFSNIKEDDFSKAVYVKELQDQLKIKEKAYSENFVFTNIDSGETYIAKQIYNECHNSLKAINDKINSIIDIGTILISQELIEDYYNDDMLWNNLLEDIKNI